MITEDRNAQDTVAAPLDKAVIVTADGFRRLDYIDGLRAIAAFWVACSHFFPGPWSGNPVANAVSVVFHLNKLPVMIFLVISGFCLYYPLARKNVHNPELALTYRDFIARRARRILPPYFGALFLCLPLVFLCPGWNTAGGPHSSPFTWASLVSHLVLVHNLIPTHRATIDFPMWSIGLEWQLYLFFPLFVFALRRYRAGITILGCLALMFAIRAVYHHLPSWLGPILRDGPFTYAPIFVTGMIVAHWTVRRPKLPAPRPVLWVAVAILFVLAGKGILQGTGFPLFTAAATALMLMLATDEQSFFHRLLTLPRLVQLGIFSYSLYLMHAPILFLLMTYVFLPHIHNTVGQLLAWGFVALPITIVLSYLFHIVFERPFIGKPKKSAANSGALRATVR